MKTGILKNKATETFHIKKTPLSVPKALQGPINQTKKVTLTKKNYVFPEKDEDFEEDGATTTTVTTSNNTNEEYLDEEMARSSRSVHSSSRRENESDEPKENDFLKVEGKPSFHKPRGRKYSNVYFKGGVFSPLKNNESRNATEPSRSERQEILDESKLDSPTETRSIYTSRTDHDDVQSLKNDTTIEENKIACKLPKKTVKYLDKNDEAMENVLGEAEKELKRRNENMELLDEIIAKSEQVDSRDFRNREFSTVLERKRRSEKNHIEELLRKISMRTASVSTLDVNQKKKHAYSMTPLSSQRAINNKMKWINETKTKARDNFLGHIQSRTIEELTIKTHMQQEKAEKDHNQKLNTIIIERDKKEQENKVLLTKIGKLEEELGSMRYTVDLLRNKLEKTLAREIENQQKLKLFQEYEPLFEDLRKDFNFQNPEQVIKRMEMLEQAQSESYTQLLEAQEQRNQMERLVEKTLKEQDEKIREKTSRLLEEKQRAENQIQTLTETVKKLQNDLKKLESYQEKYLTLNGAVIDLYDSWMKDIEILGYRNSLAFNEPDIANSHQLMAALKNILIAFTPNNAGRQYIEFSKIANAYWIKYFKEIPELKSKPKVIFEKLSEFLSKKTEQLEIAEKRLSHMKNDKKFLQIEMEKIQREKNIVETELQSKKSVHSWLSHQRPPSQTKSQPASRMHSFRKDSIASTPHIGRTSSSSDRPRSAPARKRPNSMALSFRNRIHQTRPKTPAIMPSSTNQANNVETSSTSLTSSKNFFLTQSET